jgi:hypothetical protein
MEFCNNDNNSSTNPLVHLWLVDVFNNISVLVNILNPLLSNKKILDFVANFKK